MSANETNRSIVLANRYLDSVALLKLSADLVSLPGITAATAVMATPANVERALESGLDAPESASPNDLLVAVRGAAEACEEALVLAGQRLSARPSASGGDGTAVAAPPRSIGQFFRRGGTADLALVSVPGSYAAAEAGKALDHGMHVMIFSDNVAVEDELALKRTGEDRRLLVMGPDCGTAILDGVPLGFANVVRRGPVGVIGASGTGMQEITARVHRLGSGISQAIGCGGRDMSATIGARTMIQALQMLGEDAATRVIVLVSKPPDPSVLARVIEEARRSVARGVPVVAAFVGLPPEALHGTGIAHAPTLAAAADLAVALAGGTPAPAGAQLAARAAGIPADVAGDTTATSPASRRYLRAGFSGGTFCYEALVLLAGEGVACASNVSFGDALDPASVAPGAEPLQQHTLVDFGDDHFTQGRPHPMIDPSLRDAFLLDSLADPSTAVVLFDVLLGHGSSADPVGVLVERLGAPTEGRASIPMIAHVCGTELDPQGRDAIIARLRRAGVLVADSNAEAALWAADALQALRRVGEAEAPSEKRTREESRG